MEIYTGVIIEESLENKGILNVCTILETKVEAVNEKHQTPWLTQWTLHTISIDPHMVFPFAQELSKALEKEHPWYADFNNGERYFVIYRDKIFNWKKGDDTIPVQAKAYGMALGIPEYQVDFPVGLK